jgi:ribonuclease VapC
MIVLDSSAIMSIIMDEADSSSFSKIMASKACVVSVATVLESTMVATGAGGQKLEALIDSLLDANSVEVAAVDLEQLDVARDAFRRYGKGQGHAAKLNFGDCFAYALAKTRDAPLLFKGNDFAQTDILSAHSN